MERKNSVNRKSIIGTLILLAAVLLIIDHQAGILSEKIDRHFAAVEAGQQKLALTQSEIVSRLDNVEKIVAVLRPVEIEPLDSSIVKPEKNVKQSRIKSGLYMLDRKIHMQNMNQNGFYDGNFTIYHIKAALSAGTEKTDKPPVEINIGLAIGDLTTPPVFYLDYNSDNVVDAEMMRDFASIGPLGPLLRRGINERNSQAAYNQILDHYDQASYTSLDMIEQSGQSIASSLWKFVEDQSGSMLSWIDGHGDSTPEAPAGQPAAATSTDAPPPP